MVELPGSEADCTILREALPKLPERLRQVAELRLNGLSNGETAQRLGESPGETNARFWRTLESLGLNP